MSTFFVTPRYFIKTLDEECDGFQLSTPPPFDPLDASILSVDDPWMKLTSVLEHAKRGNFSNMTCLLDILQSTNELSIWHSTCKLLAYAGPRSILESLVKEFHTKLFINAQLGYQELILLTLSTGLQLWTIPLMLRIREEAITKNRNLNAMEFIHWQAAHLLEEGEGGSIFMGEENETKWNEVVRETYETLSAQFGDQTILEGKLYSVRKHAETLHEMLGNPDLDHDAVGEHRMLFEAATGLDCRSFYAESNLQPLNAIAIVEEFLHEGSANIDQRFHPGQRYFFGHPIPP